MFELAIFAAVVWLVKSAAEDVIHAANNTPNPRYEAKRRRAAARGQSYSQPRYGSREYFGDLWSDFLVKRTELRRGKADPASAGEPTSDPTGRPGPAGSGGRYDATPVARPTASARPAGEKPSPRPRYSPKAAPSAADPNGVAGCGTCHGSGVVAELPCPTCLRVQQARNRQWEQQAPTPPTPASQPPNPDHAEPATTKSNVIPFVPRFQKEKHMTATMNAPTGEVTGLDPAIGYAKALAHMAGEHGPAGNEGYIGFLTESDVKGASLQSAHDMQEAFANAAAAAERHAAALEAQKSVQEAYDQNPDAGNKQFVTAGR